MTRKFGKFKFEDGSVWEIKVDSNTGEFLCQLSDGWIKDKDLENLKKRIAEALKQTRGLKFKPLIQIRSRPFNSSSYYPFEAERVFRAQLSNGDFIFRSFEPIVEDIEDPDTAEDYISEGKPGCNIGCWGENELLPYDFQTWLTLRALLKSFDELREKIRDFAFKEGPKRDNILKELKSRKNPLSLFLGD